MVNQGFRAKKNKDSRLPKGQYEEKDFPILSMGPTPIVEKNDWQLEIRGLVEKSLTFNWQDIHSLPAFTIKKDIHCVTKWSKFDTKWIGVSLDEIVKLVKPMKEATHIIAHSYDDYTTNIPLVDLIAGKSLIALSYEGKDISADHGGPVRLIVPHLYFWKSAKWLKAVEFVDRDIPGFWETRGYHNYGDPWKEERYQGD